MDCPDGKAMTPRGSNLYSKVQDLIDPVFGEWVANDYHKT
jgi:hypothetical protein